VKTVRFFLLVTERSVKKAEESTISCGQPKRLAVFFEKLLSFFVVPRKNLCYNDPK
jgi:hypothetical protein